MRYYKMIDSGHIVSVGIGSGGTEIDESEYRDLMSVIRKKPMANVGFDYRLKANLVWEEFELPEAEETEETVYTEQQLSAMTVVELKEICTSLGISTSMNKANMIQLILSAGGGIDG